MKGAIAAGHPLTAEVGARVLAEGGNAVDACIAASFASWVTESPLTGPAGGGFMLVHNAADGSNRLLDFFVSAPGLGLETGSAAAMEAINVDFSGDSTQVFKIGAASSAVPGALAGLEAAHRSFASLPWRDLVAPAIELARTGVELTRPQAYLHAILDLILRHTPEGRAIYGPDGRLAAGDRLVMTGPRRHARADRGARRGDAARRRARPRARRARPRAGRPDHRARPRRVPGHPSPPDGRALPRPRVLLEPAALVRRDPDRVRAAAARPARDRRRARQRGGGRRARGRDASSRAARAARSSSALLYRGGLERRLAEEEERALERIGAGPTPIAEAPPPGGTTHISVVDARGNAAALTVSTGSGSGVIVPGTGVQLNNMIGEFDLPRVPSPGTRLSSMMSPSIVSREDGGARLVVGSAGSLRLRSAVLQVIVNVIGYGMGVEEALDRPRVHVEEPYLHVEGGHDADEVDRLVARGWEVVRWRRRNLYFGGTQAVEVLADGSLAAAGDPRRGGHGIVVE